MKIARNTGEGASLDTIVALAQGLAHAKKESSYSISLEFALTELVQDRLRVMGQEMNTPASAKGLLRGAIEDVMRRVKDAIRSQEIRVDLKKYEDSVRKNLAFPAKEIEKLSEELTKSRRSHRLGSKEERTSERGRRFTVNELGFRDAIQGILIEPTREVQDIDPAAIGGQRRWQVAGEWFPYEVSHGEFIFVVDDDGSIFVSTANLPPEILDRVRTMIEELANELYA